MKFFMNYKTSIILLSGMFIGALVGLIFGEKATILQPIADIFLNLLYVTIVPLIFSSLVSAIANMKNTKTLGKILAVMIPLFLLTGVIAAVYMLIITLLFDPAKGADIVMTQTLDTGKTNLNILGMLTVNDFPLLWSRQNLMALIIFSIMFGISIANLGGRAKTIITFFDELTAVIVKLINYILYIAPLGLGAFFAVLIGEQGSNIVGPLSRSLIIFFLASALYYVIYNFVVAFLAGGKKGVKLLWKNIIDSTLIALGTCSSAAAIPTNTLAGEKIGLSSEINSLVMPMGANLHKDGAVLTQILKIVFMCSVFGVNILEPQNLIIAIVVAVISSTVMGAIPGGGYIGEIFIVSAFGFPPVAIPIMILIGTITDAPATAVNASGDIGIGMLLNRIFLGKNWINDREKVIKKEKLPSEKTK